MEAYKQEFIKFMVESDVLKFGSFTLKSGRQSPFFMNAGAYVTGYQLKKLGEYYAQAIHDNFGDDFDVLFGPAYKGIPLAVVTAIAYHELYGKEVKYCCDRKEAKDHGADKGNLLGYEPKDGDRVVMVEDVTTSGKSIDETYPKVKAAADVEIKGLIVSLNRMEVGKGGVTTAQKEIEAKYGFPVASIVSMAEVVETLYNHEIDGKVVIDDELKTAIDAYYEQYGSTSLRRFTKRRNCSTPRPAFYNLTFNFKGATRRSAPFRFTSPCLKCDPLAVRSLPAASSCSECGSLAVVAETSALPD